MRQRTGRTELRCVISSAHIFLSNTRCGERRTDRIGLVVLVGSERGLYGLCIGEDMARACM